MSMTSSKRTSRIKPRQIDKVAALLMNGPISVQDANLGYRIRSMTSRISELRRLGLPIIVMHKRTPDGQRYTKYKADTGYYTRYRALTKSAVPVLRTVNWS